MEQLQIPQTREQSKITRKPVKPQSEKPQQIITKPQLRKTSGKVEKLEGNLPTTGGKAENPHLKWIGFAFIVLVSIGFVFAIRNRKKAE
ncbi:LPXTG-domain-containing protein cell wall anchor domain [Bacillus cereus VD118]|uniref:LPXTG-domain-containing protein cell wall anchor domain n=1 Tax=Bacillus cereus VD118 TaxID=1053231 RepID=R8QX26_BACCE|nr:LPXTG-domain-containing protein cell wall anchor domain [Bacillus cereus VD118]